MIRSPGLSQSVWQGPDGTLEKIHFHLRLRMRLKNQQLNLPRRKIIVPSCARF